MQVTLIFKSHQRERIGGPITVPFLLDAHTLLYANVNLIRVIIISRRPNQSVRDGVSKGVAPNKVFGIRA